MTVANALLALQAHARALPGVADAPTRVPEGAGMFPFAVSYPRSGSLVRITDTWKGLHVLITEIHVERSMLPAAVEKAQAYIESFPNRILNDPTLGGSVSTIRMDDAAPVTYEFGVLKWGSVQTIGVRFSITVKIQGPFV